MASKSTKAAKPKLPAEAAEPTLMGVDHQSSVSKTLAPCTIHGVRFRKPVVVKVIDPTGAVHTIPAKRVSVPDHSRVKLTLQLDQVGTWLVQVFNPDDLSGSNVLPMVVGPAPVAAAKKR